MSAILDAKAESDDVVFGAELAWMSGQIERAPRPARILAELPIRTPRRGQAEITAIRAGIEYLINDDRAKRNGI